MHNLLPWAVLATLAVPSAAAALEGASKASRERRPRLELGERVRRAVSLSAHVRTFRDQIDRHLDRGYVGSAAQLMAKGPLTFGLRDRISVSWSRTKVVNRLFDEALRVARYGDVSAVKQALSQVREAGYDVGINDARIPTIKRLLLSAAKRELASGDRWRAERQIEYAAELSGAYDPDVLAARGRLELAADRQAADDIRRLSASVERLKR
jgi:hypothetical protein